MKAVLRYVTRRKATSLFISLSRTVFETGSESS